ncbi:MAG: dTDP-4-dehydrorhamnose reductase, partial [Cyanobacteriota bacterium]
LTGREGQLGQALVAQAPEGVELIATGRAELDLADAEACRQSVLELRPDWVLNAGAYTAVDKAESEPNLAQRVNAEAPGAFAAALATTGGRLLQVSTDFVFNGEQGHPYRPDQALEPLGVYGASKAEGERRVEAELGPERSCLLRTSWVYGPVGRNFCLTMLRLHRIKAEAGEALGVVADQVGCPTATPGLAAACWRAIGLDLGGRHHWSDAGAASWYDFALAIGELGTARGLLEQPAKVKSLTTAEYPTPAQRPSYSLLDCTQTRSALGLEGTPWRHALDGVLAQIPDP